MSEQQQRWKHDGVRVIPAGALDGGNVPQTPGMDRKAAIDFARAGAQKLWAGTVTIHAGAKTGAHHHGPLESVIYVVKGRARMRWGERWNSPPRPGRETSFSCRPSCRIRRSTPAADETLECVLVRSDGQATVVNLDIEPVEKPERGFVGGSDTSVGAGRVVRCARQPSPRGRGSTRSGGVRGCGANRIDRNPSSVCSQPPSPSGRRRGRMAPPQIKPQSFSTVPPAWPLRM